MNRLSAFVLNFSNKSGGPVSSPVIKPGGYWLASGARNTPPPKHQNNKHAGRVSLPCTSEEGDEKLMIPAGTKSQVGIELSSGCLRKVIMTL